MKLSLSEKALLARCVDFRIRHHANAAARCTSVVAQATHDDAISNLCELRDKVAAITPTII